jgi:exopolysaccharide biosynthesis polyprenyl glycosylphosphotransferase
MDGLSQSTETDLGNRIHDRPTNLQPLGVGRSGEFIAAAQTAFVPFVLLRGFDGSSAIPTASYLSGLLLICGFAIAATHWAATSNLGRSRRIDHEMVRRALHVAALVFLVTIAGSQFVVGVESLHAGVTFSLLLAIAWAGIGLSEIGLMLNSGRGVDCVMVVSQSTKGLDLSQRLKRDLPWAKVCIWPGRSLTMPAFGAQPYAHPALVEQAPDIALICDSLGNSEVAALSTHLAPLAIDVLVVSPSPAQQTAGEVVSLAGHSCVRLFPKPLKLYQRVTKRLFDVASSLVLLLLLAPVLCLIALAIKLDSRGPVFFRQPRVGLNGAIFTIWKFRTMFTEKADLASLNATVENDPRVTRIGARLRRVSLDELPQLFNVLTGSMALVGPRPHAMNGNHFGKVVANYGARHRVRPGITGLAQIKGWRGPTDTDAKIEQRTANDLRYIGEWSLWGDLTIIVRTAFALRGRNAF